MEGTWRPRSVHGDKHPTGQAGGWKGSCHGNVHPAGELPQRDWDPVQPQWLGPGVAGGARVRTPRRWPSSPQLCHHPLEDSDLCHPLPITLFTKGTGSSSVFQTITSPPGSLLTSKQQPVKEAGLMASGRRPENSGTDNCTLPTRAPGPGTEVAPMPCCQRRGQDSILAPDPHSQDRAALSPGPPCPSGEQGRGLPVPWV